MCLYWKKLYLCGCSSYVFRDRCPACLHSSTSDKCDKFEDEPEPRKSYFKCFHCIVAEDRAEKQAFIEEQEKAEDQRKKDAERARQLQIRRDAELRALQEREEEVRRKRDLKAEQERMRREGATWVDAQSKRGKGRKGRESGSAAGSAALSVTAFPAGPGVFAPLTAVEPKDGNEPAMPASKGTDPKDMKTENRPPAGNAGKNGSSATTGTPQKNDTSDTGNTTKNNASPTATAAPNKDNGVDPGGRAGRWGPKTEPKKILKPDKSGWKV